MIPDPRFLRQPKHFWANVRTISQQVGYTQNATRRKGEGQVYVPSLSEIKTALENLQLGTAHFANEAGPTPFGDLLIAYFEYRAQVLNKVIEPLLMDAEEAKATYEELQTALQIKDRLWKHKIPMNKQKGEKKAVAYLTAIINVLIENTLQVENAEDIPCDFDPHVLTTVTLNTAPLRTLARRVDGAFPGTVNPIAVWEIKEYYYTTTFGSRVADGVYETLLDGLELEELRAEEQIDIKHYLMVDSHYTWWICGKSYLCRIMDMLHMGYVDEVLFGREVVIELPRIVRQWLVQEKTRRSAEPQPATASI